MALFPTEGTAAAWTTVTEARVFVGLANAPWNALKDVIGDPGEELRNIAIIPAEVLRDSVAAAQITGTPAVDATPAVMRNLLPMEKDKNWTTLESCSKDLLAGRWATLGHLYGCGPDDRARSGSSAWGASDHTNFGEVSTRKSGQCSGRQGRGNRGTRKLLGVLRLSICPFKSSLQLKSQKLSLCNVGQ